MAFFFFFNVVKMGRGGIESFPSLWYTGLVFLSVCAVYASLYVEGVGILLGASLLVLVALRLLAPWLVANNPSVVPLRQRPLDLFIVVGFVVFGVIALLVDAIQASVVPGVSTVGHVSHVHILSSAYTKWVIDCDPLLGANPMWYWMMSTWSPLIYCPFYAWASLCFVQQKHSNTLRLLCVAWSTALLSSMMVILAEEVAGQYASPNVPRVLLAYIWYVILPAVVLYRVWPDKPMF